LYNGFARTYNMVTGMTVSPGKMNSWSLSILYKKVDVYPIKLAEKVSQIRAG